MFHLKLNFHFTFVIYKRKMKYYNHIFFVDPWKGIYFYSFSQVKD